MNDDDLTGDGPATLPMNARRRASSLFVHWSTPICFSTIEPPLTRLQTTVCWHANIKAADYRLAGNSLASRTR